MTLIGYARISTAEGRQVLHRQLDALNAAGCDRIFEDRASSAAPKRPNLAACLDTCGRAMSSSSRTSTASGGLQASSSLSSTGSTSVASVFAR